MPKLLKCWTYIFILQIVLQIFLLQFLCCFHTCAVVFVGCMGNYSSWFCLTWCAGGDCALSTQWSIWCTKISLLYIFYQLNLLAVDFFVDFICNKILFLFFYFTQFYCLKILKGPLVKLNSIYFLTATCKKLWLRWKCEKYKANLIWITNSLQCQIN